MSFNGIQMKSHGKGRAHLQERKKVDIWVEKQFKQKCQHFFIFVVIVIDKCSFKYQRRKFIY